MLHSYVVWRDAGFDKVESGQRVLLGIDSVVCDRLSRFRKVSRRERLSLAVAWGPAERCFPRAINRAAERRHFVYPDVGYN